MRAVYRVRWSAGGPERALIAETAAGAVAEFIGDGFPAPVSWVEDFGDVLVDILSGEKARAGAVRKNEKG